MKKYGSKNANASVAKKTVRKMLNIPRCAYCVQISTTFLLSATEALVVPSSRMCALMYSTARYAPVVNAWVEAPVNQLITGGVVFYWFNGASTQAVTTGAYRAVEYIKAHIRLEGTTRRSRR